MIKLKDSALILALFILNPLTSSEVSAQSKSPLKFVLPSYKIGCYFWMQGDSLSCSSYGSPTTDSNLRIINYPKIGDECSVDIVGISISKKGKVVGNCSGSPHPLVIDPDFKKNNISVLQYGSTWNRNGIRCTASSEGLTCKNLSQHGFFMSQQRWRTF